MNCLLDTSPYIWLIDDNTRLSKNAKAVIENSENKIYLSTISFWEIVIKRSLGKLAFEPTLDQMYQDVQTLDIALLSLEMHHLKTLETLEYRAKHKDPFDRVIISQAMAENLSIISADSKFSDYPVPLVW